MQARIVVNLVRCTIDIMDIVASYGSVPWLQCAWHNRAEEMMLFVTCSFWRQSASGAMNEGFAPF